MTLPFGSWGRFYTGPNAPETSGFSTAFDGFGKSRKKRFFRLPVSVDEPKLLPKSSVSLGHNNTPKRRKTIMAKKTTTTTNNAPTNNAPTTTTTPPNANTANKADRIREYAKANPTLGPSQIAKALTAAGCDVNASRVSTVLRQGTSSGKVDVEQIKMAAEFVKGFAGSTDEAQKAIESVGSFVERCGGAQKALGALEAYKALSSALA